MTNDEEEKMLLDKLLSARETVSRLKSEAQSLQLKRNAAQKYLDDIEQAVLDYMQGNGVLESECFRLRTTKIVDAPNVDAIPEKYIRTKIVREPNKLLIASEKPHGNWYTIQENHHVMLVGEK